MPENAVPLTRVDPATNTVRRQHAGGEHADTMRAAFGSAWIVDAPEGEIWRVDAKRVAAGVR